MIFQMAKDSPTPSDVANVWYTVRKKIGDMRATLPQGVQRPVSSTMTSATSTASIYALSANGFSYSRVARRCADDVRQPLLRVTAVAKVDLLGVQDEKVYIEISARAPRAAGLDFNAVLASQISARRTIRPRVAYDSVAGSTTVQVRVTGQLANVQDLENCARCRSDGSSGNQLRLGDIADRSAAAISIRPPAACASPGQGSDRAWRLDGQGRRHHRAGQGAAAGGGPPAAAQLPMGIELAQVQDQPDRRSSAR